MLFAHPSILPSSGSGADGSESHRARRLAQASLRGFAAVLPAVVEAAVGRYLRFADRLLPDRITGFYLVGSTALGAFRDGRSDIDFVAVVDQDLDRRELQRLRSWNLDNLDRYWRPGGGPARRWPSSAAAAAPPTL